MQERSTFLVDEAKEKLTPLQFPYRGIQLRGPNDLAAKHPGITKVSPHGRFRRGTTCEMLKKRSDGGDDPQAKRDVAIVVTPSPGPHRHIGQKAKANLRCTGSWHGELSLGCLQSCRPREE